MEAVFVELPPFACHLRNYLTDDEYRAFQQYLLGQPDAGDVIPGTGGLRKVRWADDRRGKGKRSGIRIIYYWWDSGHQFWLFTLYDKDEAVDLTTAEKKELKKFLTEELTSRRNRHDQS